MNIFYKDAKTQQQAAHELWSKEVLAKICSKDSQEAVV